MSRYLPSHLRYTLYDHIYLLQPGKSFLIIILIKVALYHTTISAPHFRLPVSHDACQDTIFYHLCPQPFLDSPSPRSNTHNSLPAPSHFRPLRGPSRSLCCLLSPVSSCSSSNSILQDSLHRPLPSSLPFLGAPPSSIHRSCSHIRTVITWIHRQLLCGQSPQPESPKSHVFIPAFLHSWPMKYWYKKPSVPAIN